MEVQTCFGLSDPAFFFFLPEKFSIAPIAFEKSSSSIQPFIADAVWQVTTAMLLWMSSSATQRQASASSFFSTLKLWVESLERNS